MKRVAEIVSQKNKGALSGFLILFSALLIFYLSLLFIMFPYLNRFLSLLFPVSFFFCVVSLFLFSYFAFALSPLMVIGYFYSYLVREPHISSLIIAGLYFIFLLTGRFFFLTSGNIRLKEYFLLLSTIFKKYFAYLMIPLGVFFLKFYKIQVAGGKMGFLLVFGLIFALTILAIEFFSDKSHE